MAKIQAPQFAENTDFDHQEWLWLVKELLRQWSRVTADLWSPFAVMWRRRAEALLAAHPDAADYLNKWRSADARTYESADLTTKRRPRNVVAATINSVSRDMKASALRQDREIVEAAYDYVRSFGNNSAVAHVGELPVARAENRSRGSPAPRHEHTVPPMPLGIYGHGDAIEQPLSVPSAPPITDALKQQPARPGNAVLEAARRHQQASIRSAPSRRPPATAAPAWSASAERLRENLYDAALRSGEDPTEFNLFRTLAGNEITHDTLGELARPSSAAFDELRYAGVLRILTEAHGFTRFYLAPVPDASAPAAHPAEHLWTAQRPHSRRMRRLLQIVAALAVYVAAAIAFTALNLSDRHQFVYRAIDGVVFSGALVSAALLALRARSLDAPNAGVYLAGAGLALGSLVLVGLIHEPSTPPPSPTPTPLASPATSPPSAPTPSATVTPAASNATVTSPAP